MRKIHVEKKAFVKQTYFSEKLQGKVDLVFQKYFNSTFSFDKMGIDSRKINLCSAKNKVTYLHVSLN